MNIKIEDPTSIITIDGPVGVGKSSVAKKVARILNYNHLDTGATYRVVTLEAMKQGVPLDNQQALTQLAKSLKIGLNYIDGKLHVYCNDKEVTDEIRDPEVSRNTSPVADCIGVRRAMGELQRKLGALGNVVCEGRDMGTVIFPEAELKFYLDGNIEERANRRCLQLKEMGKESNLEKEMQSVITRDMRDRTRPDGSLKVADGAIIIDTTMFDEDEVVDIIVEFAKK